MWYEVPYLLIGEVYSLDTTLNLLALRVEVRVQSLQENFRKEIQKFQNIYSLWLWLLGFLSRAPVFQWNFDWECNRWTLIHTHNPRLKWDLHLFLLCIKRKGTSSSLFCISEHTKLKLHFLENLKLGFLLLIDFILDWHNNSFR